MSDKVITINQLRACLSFATDNLFTEISGSNRGEFLDNFKDCCRTHDAEYNSQLFEIVLLMQSFGIKKAK
ncbi:hypothetical protein [Rhizobium sp.]|jgi:hypothetical protein|uniref:hypothetical protein n=1 Tax=Rhizobium sp. TaxID=391 RepID=UPI002AA5FFB7